MCDKNIIQTQFAENLPKCQAISLEQKNKTKSATLVSNFKAPDMENQAKLASKFKVPDMENQIQNGVI